MKRFLMGVFAVALVLTVSQAVQAQSSLPKQTQTPPKKAQKQDSVDGVHQVAVDGRKVGQVRLSSNGRHQVITLKTGHKVSVLMKNGQAVSAQAVDGKGGTVQGEVRTARAARTVVITIRIRVGGVVITITITITITRNRPT